MINTIGQIKQRLEILYQMVEDLEQSGAGEGYTKAQADAKFLSKTDAAATYIEPTDYATQTTGGTVKAWTTTSGDLITLHIATQ